MYGTPEFETIGRYQPGRVQAHPPSSRPTVHTIPLPYSAHLSTLFSSDFTTDLRTDLNCRFPLFLVVHALQEGNVPELDPIVMACTKIMCFII
jgi:hypothetical protein